MKTTVVNLWREPYDVYIGRGRGSIWGNPFSLDRYTREEAIRLYRERIQQKSCDELVEFLTPLCGKRLGCFCVPKQCHGQVLVELIEKIFGKED